jgi:DNA-binding transcriptional regulator YiaG
MHTDAEVVKVMGKTMDIYRKVIALYNIPKNEGVWMSIMATLQVLRQSAVMTQTELAQTLGVSVSTVSLWETGRKQPRPQNIRKLAEVWELSPQTVLAAIKETAQRKGTF